MLNTTKREHEDSRTSKRLGLSRIIAIAGKSPVGRRWKDIFVCSLAANAVLILALAIAPTPVLVIVGRLRPCLWVALVLLMFVGPYRSARSHWTHYFGLRHPGRYPPTWFAGIFGLPILVALLAVPLGPNHFAALSGSEVLGLLPRLLAVLAVATLLVIALHICTVRTVQGARSDKRRTRPTSADATVASVEDSVCIFAADYAALRVWLSNDEEIGLPEADAFGHRVTARKMAEMLEVGPGLRPTLALLGEQGSGKSTIRALVEHYLDADSGFREKVVLMSVSLWPFESVEAAARAILTKTVRAIGEHADTLGIAGIPTEYARLMETVAAPVAKMLGQDSGTASPDEVLDRLSAVLLAVRVDLILWVEDLERFRPLPIQEQGDFSSAQQPGLFPLLHQSASERLAPLRSLLYLLHRTQGVSVVIATRSMRDQFDIEKLARFTFEVPRATPTTVWRIVRSFRTGVLSEFAGTFIDPVTYMKDSGIVPPEDESFGYWLWDIGPHGPSPQLALGQLLSNPRSLKMALRECRDTWTQLHGEIDFDDVLVCSVLRQTAPEVFAWVNDNLSHMRSGPEESNIPAYKAQRDARTAELALTVGRAGNRIQSAAIESLLGFLFDGYGKGPKIVDSSVRPQRVSGASHVDYWKRMRSGLRVPAKGSDQEVLRAIDSWRATKDAQLLGLVLDPDRMDGVYHFSTRLNKDELCLLLDQVAAKLEFASAANWPEEKHPSIRELYRMMRRNLPISTELGPQLLRTITRAMVKNLALVHTLIYFFVEKEDGRSILAEKDIMEIRSTLGAFLAKSFAPYDTISYISALMDGSVYLSKWLARAARRAPAIGLDDLPFGEWTEFASVLLVAAEQNIVVGLSQILPFIVEQLYENGGSRRCTFVEKRAKELFDMDRLIPLIKNADSNLPWPVEVRDLLDAAQRYVRGMGTGGIP